MATFSFVDFANLPITPDSIIINGVSQTLGTSLVFDDTNIEKISITVSKAGYYSYTNIFKKGENPLEFPITLIGSNCQEAIESCCSTSFFIVDSACNNTKVIYKTSSSPGNFYIIIFNNNNESNFVVFSSSAIVISDEMFKGKDLDIIISSSYHSGCCGNAETCLAETSITIPYQDYKSFLETSILKPESCNNYAPYIYESQYYYPNLTIEREGFWNFNFFPIIKPINLYNASTGEWDIVMTTKQIEIVYDLANQEDLDINGSFVLEEGWGEEEFSQFILDTSFEQELSKGIYKLNVSFQYGECCKKEYEYNFYVESDLRIYNTENCPVYNIPSCSPLVEIEIFKYQNANFEEIASAIVSGDNVQSPVESDFATVEKNEFIDIRFLEDGIYKVIVRNGIETLTHYIVSLCKIKSCYLNIVKGIACSSTLDFSSYKSYRFTVLKMLYDLLLEYYNDIIPISIKQTILNDIEIKHYIQIDNIIKQLSAVCKDCSDVLDDSKDCGCDDNKSRIL